MKNNFPTEIAEDEAEELEQALIRLHERKRSIEVAMRRLDNAEVILLVAMSITLGIFIGIQIK